MKMNSEKFQQVIKTKKETKMIETVENSISGGFSKLKQRQRQQSFGGGSGGAGDSSEEELAVLPVHTKVVVTGNNRTKSVLVGLQGVVKKAVGLGGWHWLVLTNGIEVKLQRNALSVIEAPTGLENDADLECEKIPFNGSGSDETQKSKRTKRRSRRSVASEKTVNRSLSCDSRTKESVSPARGSIKVDISKLGITALLRYLQYFNLMGFITDPSREHLINIVQKHFMSQEEKDELTSLMGIAEKCLLHELCKDAA